jgi:hypothetical protein
MRSFRDRHPPSPGSLLLPGRAGVITVGRAGRPLCRPVNDNRRSPRRSVSWPAWRRDSGQERASTPAANPRRAAGGGSPRMMARWGWPGATLGIIGALLALGYWL